MIHLQRTCAVVFALTMLIALPSVGQNTVTLDIGSVTVWLGMPKTDVLRKLAGTAYKVTDLGDWILVDSYSSVHDLRFRDRKMIYADREWYMSNETDEAGAVIGALGALAQKSNGSACVVTHDPVAKPTISLDRIFVLCGRTIRSDGTVTVERSVVIALGVISGKKSLNVTERIGEFPNSN
ncbi:MAG TPA: hypothetical protein VII95_09795 [Terriglobales bacterium]|jgi:hypothetical protein